MSKRIEKMKENVTLQGGRPQRRTTPDPNPATEVDTGPGKRADERIVSIPVDEILPDRYQGRLRWPVDVAELERLYMGEWDAQDLLTFLARRREEEPTPALEDAWQATTELARSILSEGQIAPITVQPSKDLPLGYRFVIETGEGRFWAYQMMRWLLANDPDQLEVSGEEWHEDPAFIRAVAISEPSRLRQVAENEQRQSYASAVDRAVAYASMLAEDAHYTVEGRMPGIRDGRLELPEAYQRAARRGLRGRQAVVQQVPAGARQIQRHLKLLTDLDPSVLALGKQHGLSEAQLRPLVGKPPEEQRYLVTRIVQEGLSSREAARALVDNEAEVSKEEETYDEEMVRSRRGNVQGEPLTLPEEVARFLRSLTLAAARYEKLSQQASDTELRMLLEAELRSYDESAKGAQRVRTPRRRLEKLQTFLKDLR